jgi:hypothetical protein
VFATDPMGSALVADLSVRIGLRQGLRPAVLRTLAEGPYLHDVGEVGTPDHILNKPGTLTGEEHTWVQQHPLVGWTSSDAPLPCRSVRAVMSSCSSPHGAVGAGEVDGRSGIPGEDMTSCRGS